MTQRISNILLFTNIVTWLLVLALHFYSQNVIHVVLGIPFLMFFPGFTLLAALLGKKKTRSVVERVALSFALSLVVVPFLGLILNYTPWGINQTSVVYSIAAFITITSCIAWLRKGKTPENIKIEVAERVSALPQSSPGRNLILTVIMVIVVIGTLSALVFFISTPKTGETFTSYWVLAPGDRNTNYVREVKVNEECKVDVKIYNHEGKDISYNIYVYVNGIKNTELDQLKVINGKELVSEVVFIPQTIGDNQKVEFIIYKDNQTESSLKPLYLWIDVLP